MCPQKMSNKINWIKIFQHDLNTQAQSNFIKIDESKSQTNNDIVIATSTGVKKKEKSKREKRSQLTCLICNVTFQERSELDVSIHLKNHGLSKRKGEISISTRMKKVTWSKYLSWSCKFNYLVMHDNLFPCMAIGQIYTPYIMGEKNY